MNRLLSCSFLLLVAASPVAGGAAPGATPPGAPPVAVPMTPAPALPPGSPPVTTAPGTVPAVPPPVVPVTPAPAAAPPAPPVAATVAVDDPRLEQLYQDGRRKLQAGRSGLAALELYLFLSQAPEIHDQYGWAEYLLAQAFSQLELHEAAAEYLFNVARQQRTPVLLPRALLDLELLCRTVGCDEETIQRSLLDGLETGDALPARAHDFLFYIKGLLAYRDGQTHWGEEAFARIREVVRYRLQALLIQAIHQVKEARLDRARRLLQQLLEEPTPAGSDPELVEVQDDARETLARLEYEQGRYPEAWKLYEQVRDPQRHRSHLPLEKAWTRYYLHQWPEALGLLYALEAPSFRGAYLPDKYVLRGIILTNLCHFEAAEQAVQAFRLRFGPALDTVRQRRDPRSDPALLAAALARPEVAHADRLWQRAQVEQRRVRTIKGWQGTPLASQLERLYEQRLRQLAAQRDQRIHGALEEIQNDLIRMEEQMRLLAYEVGLAKNQRIRRGAAQHRPEEPIRTLPLAGPDLFSRPDGEYWNGELHNYTVLIRSKCEAATPWE